MDILKALEPTSIFSGFDLLSIGLAVAATGILGFVVFLNNRRNITNQSFFLFTLFTILWGIVNYLSYQFNIAGLVIWILRMAIFFAVWHTFSFFTFCFVYPRDKLKFPRWYKFVLVPLVVIISSLTLTPLVFSGVESFYSSGQVSKVGNGPAIPLFGLLVVGLIFSGIFLLFKKMFKVVGTERTQLIFIIVGTVITFILILIFNFVLPALFGIAQFVSLGGIFLIPFIALTFYAIARHQLFEVKVIATEMLIFVIWVAIIIELLMANSLKERIVEGGILLLMIIFGIFLIRSVRLEVSRREEFELLSKELGAANEKLKELDQMKTDFISIASHQLRTPLTAIKGYSSMLLEDTYGELPLKVRGTVEKVFQSAQRLIFIVNDLLDTSRIEQGRFQVSFERVGVANIIKDVVEELKPNAETRGLQLQLEMSPDDAEIVVQADPSKLRQVVTNLIDNAIKYTEQGYVTVVLRKTSGGNRALISVKDTGFGMSAQSMQNLFQKFSRAKNVSKLHVDGSGLGLFIAKQIIEAHNGRIWAESAGENKGSQFYVELPMG
ncbi:MAG: ATP-binding protein [Patescibacteria group bacterium]